MQSKKLEIQTKMKSNRRQKTGNISHLFFIHVSEFLCCYSWVLNHIINLSSFRANRIQELTSLREEYEAQMQSTQTHVNNLSYNISTSEAREKELKRSLIAISNEITNKERELKNIQNQRDNKLVLFGDGFPKLVAEIEKNYQKVTQDKLSYLWLITYTSPFRIVLNRLFQFKV